MHRPDRAEDGDAMHEPSSSGRAADDQSDMEDGHLALRSIAAFADHEFDPDTEDESQPGRHLAECMDCQARVRNLRELSADTGRLLVLLDTPAPLVTARSVIARAKLRGPSSRARIGAIVAAAAGIAVAAAALPPSPLHGAFINILSAVLPAHHQPTARTVAPMQATRAARRGVSLIPDARLDVVLPDEQSAGTLSVGFAGGPSAALSEINGNDVVYHVSKDRITVVNGHSAGSFTLILPRSLARASIRIGPTLVFSIDAGVTTTLVPPDDSGRYVFPLARSR